MRILVLGVFGCAGEPGAGTGSPSGSGCIDPDVWTCSSTGDDGCDAVCDGGQWLFCDRELNGGVCLVGEGMQEEPCEVPTAAAGCEICAEALRSTCRTLLR